MMRNVLPFSASSSFLFTASCAAKKNNNVFVLLPGPDGKTGEINHIQRRDSGPGEPNQAVAVSSADAAPSSPTHRMIKKFGWILASALRTSASSYPFHSVFQV
jgi:hypothetical protein